MTANCDCGAEKAKTTHAAWCSTFKEEETDPFGLSLEELKDSAQHLDIEYLAEIIRDGGYSPKVVAGSLTGEEMQRLIDALEDLEDDSNSFD
jgi:hypothetical protein